MDKTKEFAELLRTHINDVVTDCLILGKTPKEMKSIVAYAVHQLYGDFEDKYGE